MSLDGIFVAADTVFAGAGKTEEFVTNDEDERIGGFAVRRFVTLGGLFSAFMVKDQTGATKTKKMMTSSNSEIQGCSLEQIQYDQASVV